MLATLARCPSVFPDYPAPVIRNVGDDREMVLRWSMAPLPRTGRAARLETETLEGASGRAFWLPPGITLRIKFSSAEYF